MEAIRTGDLVRVRESTWRVVASRAYAKVRALRLVGVDDVNRARDCTLFMPFDVVERVGETWRPRVVSRRRWMRALSGLLLASQPRDIPSSVASADVSLHPYQMDPLLSLLRGEASRVLIADEVGLGKTVQAALVVKELAERGFAARVLLLVPAGLREQWREELRARVAMAARMVDAEWLARAAREMPAEISPWSLPGVYLASLDFIKQGDVLRGLRALSWDVLIIDEAHALVAGSERARAARRLGVRSRLVLLLTATPHSGSVADFDTLCGIGRIGAGRLERPEPLSKQRPATPTVDACVDGGARDDPLVIFRRSRRAAIRGGVRRREHLLRVCLTVDERRMHELLGRYVRAVERRTPSGDPARLAMVVLRKRASSSAWSLSRSVARRWQLIAARVASPEQLALPFWLSAETEDEEGSDDEPGVVLGAAGLPVRHERAWLGLIGEVARRAAKQESKIRALDRLLQRTAARATATGGPRDRGGGGAGGGDDAGGAGGAADGRLHDRQPRPARRGEKGESVVVFTEYRDTLSHIADCLDRRLTMVRLHGGLGVEARRAALARFDAGDARVLLATDAAGEGLNLQRRCRVVVQIELPWNPTRVEQRIGRVDRLGQRRTVHAWQFVSHGTYEQRVQRGLRERLSRVEAAIGGGGGGGGGGSGGGSDGRSGGERGGRSRGDTRGHDGRRDRDGDPMSEATVPDEPVARGVEAVRRAVTSEARAVSGRLRVMRFMASLSGVSPAEDDGHSPEWLGGASRRRSSGRRGILPRALEGRAPWVTFVRSRAGGPFADDGPGVICVWRVHLRAADGGLVETRVVPVRLSGIGPTRRGDLSAVSALLQRWRQPMQRAVAQAMVQAGAEVWASERRWRQRWDARDRAIRALLREQTIVPSQAQLFPEMQEIAHMNPVVVPDERPWSEPVPEPSTGSPPGEREGLFFDPQLSLVIVLSRGARAVSSRASGVRSGA